MVLNEFSLMLFACVLVDTFLVRTTLVPALVSLAGEYNWWPRQVRSL
jgi:RND superfamily putative drug exporter